MTSTTILPSYAKEQHRRMERDSQPFLSMSAPEWCSVIEPHIGRNCSNAAPTADEPKLN